MSLGQETDLYVGGVTLQEDPRRHLFYARMRKVTWWALVALLLGSVLASGATLPAKVGAITWLAPLACAWHVRNRRITAGVNPVITDAGIRVGSEYISWQEIRFVWRQFSVIRLEGKTKQCVIRCPMIGMPRDMIAKVYSMIPPEAVNTWSVFRRSATFAVVGILMLSLNVASYRLYKEIASCVIGCRTGSSSDYASSCISLLLVVLFVLLIPEPQGLGVAAFLLSWPVSIAVRFLLNSCVGHRVEIMEELGRLVLHGLMGLILLILVLYLLRIESRHGIPV